MSASGLFENGGRPNILIIITDQERAVQHWPESFSKEHLPSMERLKKHGLDFRHHYTNSCMCSPSRSTLLTSRFPSETGVTTTGSPAPKKALPTNIPNLATVLKQAGYPRVEWHGKWHVGNTPSDYGFEGWQPPDAGNYLCLNETLGGGTPDNDGRFLKDLCHSLEKYHDNTKNNNNNNNQHQNRDEPQPEPFCIVASFVNPHDVYVAQHDPGMGYTRDDFYRVEVPLPSNHTEDPYGNNKPRAQGRMSSRCVPFRCSHQEYVNFYAYLHTIVDAQIGTLLDKVEALGFTDSTLILRTADHGEQGLSHSLVEKFYNCYQESLRVPLVVSNPLAFPEPQSTDALSSHLDILPTLAALLSGGGGSNNNNDRQAPLVDSYSLQGNDLTPILNNPQTTTTIAGSNKSKSNNETRETTILGVQASIHFTYDDIPCPGAPSTIRCLHRGDLKYAVYFTPNGMDADWELYDLSVDPLENTNVAADPDYRAVRSDMEQELYDTMVKKGTLPRGFRWPPRGTSRSRGSIQHPPPEQHPVSYEFFDEGPFATILLGMKDARSKCTNVLMEWGVSSLSVVVQNYDATADVSLQVKRLNGEITDAKYKIEDHGLVLTLTKKEPGAKWETVHSTVGTQQEN